MNILINLKLFDYSIANDNLAINTLIAEESCYKTVDTKHGPQLILSVSRTFIKLKNLILEKRSLQNEIDNLKNLNTKLESKVIENCFALSFQLLIIIFRMY
jgi:hypothetical protein